MTSPDRQEVIVVDQDVNQVLAGTQMRFGGRWYADLVTLAEWGQPFGGRQPPSLGREKNETGCEFIGSRAATERPQGTWCVP